LQPPKNAQKLKNWLPACPSFEGGKSFAGAEVGEIAVGLDRLSAEDERILKLEGGAIGGHTCKVIVLKASEGRDLPTLAELRASIDARLDDAPRLRKRLVMTPLSVARPVWADDPQFSIARHVTSVANGESVSRPELSKLVSDLMCERLDRAHPLWHLDVVESVEHDSMALVWRIHHCLADGATCVALASAVLWSQDPDAALPRASDWTPEATPSRLSLLASGLKARARAPRGDVARWLGRPRRTHSLPGVFERELSPSAALTQLSHRVGFARSVAFAVAPLDGCKRAGKAIDATVTLNDVVLAIVSGGVREWLSGGHGPMEGIRVQIPVSLHQAQEGFVANRDSYFFVDLPVAEPDVAQRVLKINRETTQRKLDQDAETLSRLGHHPLAARWAMSPRVFTFNVSNVRGPTDDVYVLGSRVCEVYSLAEIAQHHALRVAVISAAGSLFFGLCADRDAVGDLGVLADAMERSASELIELSA
jgi:WS/DGAT/MGAT family acyltransferase